MRHFLVAAFVSISAFLCAERASWAQPIPATSRPAPVPAPAASGDSAVPRADLTPRPVDEPPLDAKHVRFVADPVGDGAVLAMSLAWAGLLDLVLSTGELRPQQPAATSSLLGIDRFATTQTIDPNAGTRSNFGLYGALAFAVVDPVLTGFRDSPSAGLVDGVLYAESLSITWGITDLAKIAVRRPRPSAYIEEAQLVAQYGKQNTPEISSTNAALSFFSGHASTVATVGATATYLAFARSPDTARPWITLGAATLLTAFVSYERVRAGDHFPTDVIAGSLAGAGIGVLVPHMHRADAEKQRPVWIGFDSRSGGGLFTASGSW